MLRSELLHQCQSADSASRTPWTICGWEAPLQRSGANPCKLVRGPVYSASRGLIAPISLHRAQRDFRAALCDSFNTPVALGVLLDLVAQTNIYFSRTKEYNIGVVESIAEWVTRMLKMFGLGEGPTAVETGEIGWGKVREDASEAGDVSNEIN